MRTKERTILSGEKESLAVGRVIDGRYELLKVLGEGGFGVVYKARQVSTGQPVAIKFMHQRHLGGSTMANQAMERFEREMNVIALLKHPNIVRLIDSGRLEEGTLYTVIEFVDGVDLGTLLERETQLSVSEACRLMGQVLEALGCAHEAGVVHRDLKPDNIMITRSGTRRSALVLDFGIAGLIEPEATSAGADTMDSAPVVSSKRLTVTGQFIGTPAYMAPEQFTGEPPTLQTDIYSWGLVFIEALTGRVAMDATSLPELLMKHMSDEPVPLPAELVETPLGRLLARATAKSLHARYANASAVLSDLDGCVARASVQVQALKAFSDDAFSSTGDVSLAAGQAAARLERKTGEGGGGVNTERGDVPQSSDAPSTGPQPVVEAATDDVDAEAPASTGSKLTLILVALVALVLVGATVLVIMLVSGGGDSAPAEASHADGASDEPQRTDAADVSEPAPDAVVAVAAADVSEPAPDTAAQPPPAPLFEPGISYRPQGTRGGDMLFVDSGQMSAPGDLAARLAPACSALEAAAGPCVPSDWTSVRLEPQVDAFLLDRTEVSNADYGACVADGACPAIDYGRCLLMGRSGAFEVHALRGDGLERIRESLGGAALPATCVSAAEAERFCTWAGKRLSGESEWVFAASTGGERVFPWGDTPPGAAHANGADASLAEAMRWRRNPPLAVQRGEGGDGQPFAAPVGAFAAGAAPSGHLDLSGNVREWVAPGAASGRLPDVVRGGGWADAGASLSSMARWQLPPETRRADLGFRCAVSASAVAP